MTGVITGTTMRRSVLEPDPVRPLLFLPEVVDESKWLGGWDGLYADRGKQYLPGFTGQVSRTAYLNTSLVSPQDVTTEQDLLDPRWKGKIVLQDPRGGAGLAILSTFLVVDGEDFVRALLRQDLIVSSDNRQIAEWLVRARYPVAIGVRSSDLLTFFQQGLGQDVKAITGMRAQSFSVGSGGIQLINRAPQHSLYLWERAGVREAKGRRRNGPLRSLTRASRDLSQRAR